MRIDELAKVRELLFDNSFSRVRRQSLVDQIERVLMRVDLTIDIHAIECGTSQAAKAIGRRAGGRVDLPAERGVLRCNIDAQKGCLRGVVLRSPREEIGVGQREHGGIAADDADFDETVGFGKREGTQQNRVHDREDRRRRADPQRQRENGDRGEARFLD